MSFKLKIKKKAITCSDLTNLGWSAINLPDIGYCWERGNFICSFSLINIDGDLFMNLFAKDLTLLADRIPNPEKFRINTICVSPQHFEMITEPLFMEYGIMK